ncbi:protein kinase [Streptomyces sp. NPDC020362]|uniref:serine/threonine-protein kinase n=1 Tax=Streptomyces sp. NPDC020362 TaxID=3154486 RepID=UPI0033FA8515
MALHEGDPGSLGGYRIVDRLGAGGMGVVYRARARSGREVAVKVVHAQYAENAVFRARFRQEIEAVRKVSGAFTAPVVDADPEAVRPWMATQYVPGRSLSAGIRANGPLSGAELRRLALGLVEALRDIHRAGVVHRDLKPANVLMADDGPRVIDFGISRAAENQTLTETGNLMGTPPFMSPEQLTDARSVGPASDVFSLGALVVFAATGRGPFDADNPYLTAYRVMQEEPDLAAVTEPLRTVLSRCLAKDPAARPALDMLAAEFASALPESSADDAYTVPQRHQDPEPTRPPTAAPSASPSGSGPLEASAASGPGSAPAPAGAGAVGVLPVSGSESVTGPMVPEPALGPMVPEPALGPMVPEPALGPMVPEPARGPADDAPASPARSRRLPYIAGAVGVLVAALMAYLLGPLKGGGAEAGHAPSPSATSRWQAVPDGWRPWRTTVFADAAGGVVKAPAPASEGSLSCETAGGALYCAGDSVLPVRLDALTGKLLWRTDDGPSGRSASRYENWILGVHDGVVLLRRNSFLDVGSVAQPSVVALDTGTGRQLWSRPVGEAAGNAPYLAAGVALVPDRDGGRTFTARSLRDGTSRWSVTLPADHACSFHDPGGGLYAVCSRYTGAHPETLLLAVDRTDGTTRALATLKVRTEYLGVLDGRLVFAEEGAPKNSGPDDTAYARAILVDPRTGAQDTVRLADKPTGAVSLVAGMLCFTVSNGQVTAVSPRTGKRLWRTRTTLEQPGSPVADGRGRTVFLPSVTGRVAALDARAGTVLFESYPGADGAQSGYPALVFRDRGALTVAAPDGTVFSLDPAHPGRTPASA